jgi:hypothetical protein
VNAVRVPLVRRNVGLGFGLVFLGREHDVHSCAAIALGEGHATTEEEGGPGLYNGHFDYDTSDARIICPGTKTCTSTSKHTHQFDDKFDVTYTDQFYPLDGHLSLSSGGTTPMIPVTQDFKITVVNANLSPGVWFVINGVEYDVTEYDDIPFSKLPTWRRESGPIQLRSLQVHFDPKAIANCKLHPTRTTDVRNNTPGVYGEWRNGALTMQLVKPDAVFTPGKSAGGHDVVINQANGLLFEDTAFWHWSGPSYIAKDAAAWQAMYDDLDCPEPEFVTAATGTKACP